MSWLDRNLPEDRPRNLDATDAQQASASKDVCPFSGNANCDGVTDDQQARCGC